MLTSQWTCSILINLPYLSFEIYLIIHQKYKKIFPSENEPFINYIFEETNCLNRVL